MEAFAKLQPAFGTTRLVYLQGWGEPFTHPQLFEMIRLAKQAGCMVGTTSNGTLLNPDVVARLVNEGLDVIGFSLAGIDESNDRIRKGTRIKKVLACIEEFKRAKQKYASDTPAIHIAYMLLRSGLGELERLPEFFWRAGADQTVVSSLSFVADRAMASEAVLAGGIQAYLELKQCLKQIGTEAAINGTDFHFHLVAPVQDHFSCSENIPRAVVVGSDGSVSPCVMKQMPVTGDNFYYVGGQKQLQINLSFGNIQTDSLDTIWRRKGFKQFVRAFQKSQAPSGCRHCLKASTDNLF